MNGFDAPVNTILEKNFSCRTYDYRSRSYITHVCNIVRNFHLSAYPSIYGFRWTEVEDGVFAWDGSLLSNTPVREVIEASPRDDKHIFIVENYPRKIDRLPSDMMEVEVGTRQCIHSK